MAVMTGGEAVLRALMAQGVDTVFGIIATHTINLYDALYDLQGSMRHIGGRLELGLGFMAGGYARASGRPGVFITSAGPGAADSMGAMGEEYASCTPLLQFSTNVESTHVGAGRGARHEHKDQVGMFRTVTEWNALIPSVEAIPDHVHEAFRRFQVGRPRPIELEVPTDLLGAKADVEIGPAAWAVPPMGDEGAIQRLVGLLWRARRPILLVGDQVIHRGATEEVLRLAEALGAPVGLLDGAKGAVPDDHPLVVGTVMGGRHYGRNPLWEFLPTCDLSVVVGSNLLSRDTADLGLKLPMPLAHIDADEECFHKNYPAEVTVAGDPKRVLQQVLEALEGADVDKGDGYRREVAAARDAAAAAVGEQWPNETRAFLALREVLPRDTIMVMDVTVAATRAARSFPVYEPRTFIQPWGWAGLGFGFPAALGAKVARPDRPVVCITGDGGFQYNMQELGTAVQHGIAPIVIIVNDNAWGVLKERQGSWLKGRYIATDLVNPDFMKLADAYGIPGQRVDTVAGLCRAVQRALEQPGTIHLIEVQAPRGMGELR